MTVRDETLPSGSWQFDEAVTAAFDDMLERSIPAYSVMRELTTVLATRYLQEETTLVDLGCSRGTAIERVLQAYPPPAVEYLGVEVSEPMLAAARARFGADPRVRIERVDLRHAYPEIDAVSVTLAILTLQFVPIEYRQRVLRRAFESTIPGGALILVEKVLGSTADLDEAFVQEYLRHKGRQGYTAEQIVRKREALEGVLVPITAEWNEELLRRAGFSEVDGFWRWLNFAGWVAVRGS